MNKQTKNPVHSEQQTLYIERIEFQVNKVNIYVIGKKTSAEIEVVFFRLDREQNLDWNACNFFKIPKGN